MIFISFHFIYCYYKNKFLYKSPHEGVLTSYVIYLPTYLRYEFFIIERGTPHVHTYNSRNMYGHLKKLVPPLFPTIPI